MDKRFEEARKLCNVFRFTDGLNAINDSGIFQCNFRDIYLEELELYRENGNNAEASFLDLFSLFDKRDSFLFNIVRIPEKSSNVPSNIFYMSIGAKCLRIPSMKCMISQGVDFSTNIKVILTMLHKVGKNN